jgi:hypothetical protein
VDRKAANPLFTQRKALKPWRSDSTPALSLAMIFAGNKPDVLDDIQRHALAIIPDRDSSIRCPQLREGDRHLARIGIICVLHKFEERQSCRSDQLIAEQLKQPGSWPESAL